MQKQFIQQKTNHTKGSSPLPLNPFPLPHSFAGPPTAFGSGHTTGQVIHHPVLLWTAFSIEGLTVRKALLSQGNPSLRKIRVVDHPMGQRDMTQAETRKELTREACLVLCLLHLHGNMCRLSGRSTRNTRESPVIPITPDQAA